MQQILAATEDTGQPFRVGQSGTMIGLVGFQPGASWTLQVEIPSDPRPMAGRSSGAHPLTRVASRWWIPSPERSTGWMVAIRARRRGTLGDDGEAYRG